MAEVIIALLGHIIEGSKKCRCTVLTERPLWSTKEHGDSGDWGLKCSVFSFKQLCKVFAMQPVLFRSPNKLTSGFLYKFKKFQPCLLDTDLWERAIYIMFLHQKLKRPDAKPQNKYKCIYIYIHTYVYILSRLRAENLGSFEHKPQSRIWDIYSHMDWNWSQSLWNKTAYLHIPLLVWLLLPVLRKKQSCSYLQSKLVLSTFGDLIPLFSVVLLLLTSMIELREFAMNN